MIIGVPNIDIYVRRLYSKNILLQFQHILHINLN